jgi:hypothetical protein
LPPIGIKKVNRKWQEETRKDGETIFKPETPRCELIGEPIRIAHTQTQ